ncbi:MAG TPA: hypothetical protein VMT19_05195 [Thermoanaerobaculaceae bacterium]|nr:hypothetical protein [Thermoanaerobaculaceae bacterium]
MRAIVAVVVIRLAAAVAAAAQPPVVPPNPPAAVVFVEPEGAPQAGELPLYRKVTDPARIATFSKWLDNEAARWALDLYARARGVALVHSGARVQPAEYIVALVPEGNGAAVGFRLRTDTGIESHPGVAFIQLGPEEWRFSTTLLHETGHVVLAMLAGGREIPKREIAAIPHTVAALTDRGTAFDEGFAISLETLIAHLSSAPEVVRQYRHEQFIAGPQGNMRAEYYRPSADLLTFAQTYARYGEVRDDAFAFAPAFIGPDYLRVQMEKARDFADLRDADQLLASEGFVGSFFFTVLVRGDRPPGEETVRARENAVMTVLAETLVHDEFRPDAPLLLEFLERYGKVYPAEWREVLDVFLDLSRGVFVDRDAAEMWRSHYLAALALDLAHLDREKIDRARERWRSAIQADPKVLYSRLGPSLRCEVAERRVKLVGLESDRPLSFDVNTVEEGVMRLVPGITHAEIASWRAARAKAPFSGVEDFRSRSGLSASSLGSLRF